ncbi:MAG: type II toxin-antitoxin system RelE/ParE family toxin [Sphingobium sp.]
MVEVRFAAAAKRDLIAIDDYSAEQFGDDSADDYARELKKAFKLLRDHPLAGRAMPELGRGMRCLTHRSHRIFYRADKILVLVVRIIHQAQDARTALRKAGEQ